MRMSVCFLIVGALCLSTATTANAGLVLGSPILVNNSALGFGNAPPVLTLDASPNESGAVAWDGAQDVEIGDVVPGQTETITAGQISTDLGLTNLGVFFNMNESGPQPRIVDLMDLTVTLYNAADGTPIASGSIDAGDLQEVGGGQGGDGWFFPLSDMAGELTTFFMNGANRLGMSATINGTTAGAESFRVAAVPEPSAVWCVGLVGLIGYVTNLKRKKMSKGPE